MKRVTEDGQKMSEIWRGDTYYVESVQSTEIKEEGGQTLVKFYMKHIYDENDPHRTTLKTLYYNRDIWLSTGHLHPKPEIPRKWTFDRTMPIPWWRRTKVIPAQRSIASSAMWSVEWVKKKEEAERKAREETKNAHEAILAITELIKDDEGIVFK